MTPPLGVLHDSEYVCKLNKELYILKQTPYDWFNNYSYSHCSSFGSSMIYLLT